MTLVVNVVVVVGVVVGVVVTELVNVEVTDEVTVVVTEDVTEVVGVVRSQSAKVPSKEEPTAALIRRAVSVQFLLTLT